MQLKILYYYQLITRIRSTLKAATICIKTIDKTTKYILLKASDNNDLEGRTAWGTNAVYAVSLSAASR